MNRPGAAAREQAVALRREAPVRTLLARAMRVHTDEQLLDPVQAQHVLPAGTGLFGERLELLPGTLHVRLVSHPPPHGELRDGLEVQLFDQTMLLVLGINQRAVMGLMGWSNSAMTTRYQHLTPELRRDT